MKLKEFDILLDIKKTKKIEYIEIVQGDCESNVFNISVVEDLEPYSLTGLNVEIAFAKPDGTTVLQDDVEIQGNKIICTLKTNTIAAPGKVLAEVRILQDLKLLTTARFDFFVRKAIVNDETIESTNEFPLLQRLTDDVQGVIATEEFRQNQEQIRIRHEQDRVTNEIARVIAEQARIEAETDRVTAETNRENNFNQAIDDFIAETERVETIYPTRLTNVENDLAQHKLDYMPHQIKDIDNDKSYRYGLKQENGHVILIYKEVE